MAGEFERTKTGQYVHDVEQPEQPEQSAASSSDVPDLRGIVTQHEHRSLIRGLGQRHIQMIAIAGAVVRDVELQGGVSN